ncbi:hypothetical protein BDW59DRAFT_148416 [Aspergillus cavernicola]|uniref:Uncharacterized protein n=1 Tax=Aspergillus cavernicola TaxID=176166 RepID=A0ABR4I7L5_9EURO
MYRLYCDLDSYPTRGLLYSAFPETPDCLPYWGKTPHLEALSIHTFVLLDMF